MMTYGDYHDLFKLLSFFVLSIKLLHLTMKTAFSCIVRTMPILSSQIPNKGMKHHLYLAVADVESLV